MPGAADLRALITDEVVDALDRSLIAEASGDVEQAISHFQTSPLARSSPHLRYLYEVRDLGCDAPGWLWSRWILQQAHRWLLLNQDERIREALVVTIGTVYSDVDPGLPLDRKPEAFVSEVMAMDWMCRQLTLYEMGGLANYLNSMARQPLLNRADRIMDWPAAPMGAFRIEGVAREATLTDLADGTERQVLNLGRLAEGLGACVVGRLVPMRCEPGWVFDSRPREVPDAVAEEVSRVVAEQGSRAWVQVLGEAVVSGELDWPLGAVACLTTLSSDLLPYSWSGSSGELAEAAYEVCASSLRAVTLRDSSVVRAAPYVAAVLVDPHVYGAARDRLTGHDHEAAWEALARNTHEPVSSRCRELAALCREYAEQVD